MIFAAGLGKRLGPTGVEVPKALLEIGGITLLERTVERLAGAGCGRIVVNVHHHAQRIESFIRDRTGRAPIASWHGAELVVSREPEAPLETGGGLLEASPLLRPGHGILIHNVDVISSIDLTGLMERHEATGALATLAVNRRDASRRLVFDDDGLCGRIDTRTGREEWARRPAGPVLEVGFTGVHAVSAGFVAEMTERGVFSILEPYLRLARVPGRILAHEVSDSLWMDVGTPERLAAARAHFAETSG